MNQRSLFRKQSRARVSGLALTLLLLAPGTALALPDVLPPTVSTISPLTATANVSKTYSATVSDNVAVTNCTAFLSDDSQEDVSWNIPATISGNTASYDRTLTPGNYSMRMTCFDAAGNSTQGYPSYLTVSPDTSDPTAPTIGPISPLSAMAGTATTYSASVSDNVGVVECKAYTDAAVHNGTVTLSGGTVSVSVNWTQGTHYLQFRCRDAANNWKDGTNQTITVNSAVDTQPPTWGPVSPQAATVGVSQQYSMNASDNVGITSCNVSIDGAAPINTPYVNGKTTYSTSFNTAGSHTVDFSCFDAMGFETVGQTMSDVTVNVSAQAPADTQPPTWGPVSPKTATVGILQQYSMTASDNVGITSCNVSIDGAAPINTPYTNGKTTHSTSFNTAGSHTVDFSCFDAMGFETVGQTMADVTVNVSAQQTGDTQVPIVSTISPLTATANVSKTYSATVSDNVAVTNCTAFLSDDSQEDVSWNIPATISGNTASYDRTLTPGNYSMRMTCFDAAGNSTQGYPSYLTVSPDTSDPTAPTIGPISPLSAMAGTATTYSASVSDNVGVVECKAYTDAAVHNGTVTLSGGTVSVSVNWTQGTHYLQFRCRDAANNWKDGTNQTITVGAAQADTQLPQLGSISPTTVTSNASVTYSAMASDNVGITQCTATVDNVAYTGTVVYQGGIVSLTTSFAPGGHALKFSCRDAKGNWGTTETTIMTTTEAVVDGDTPVVGSVTLAYPQNAQIYTVAYQDAVGVTQCQITSDGGSTPVAMHKSGGTTMNGTMSVGLNLSPGAHTLQASCRDAAGNWGVSPSTPLTVVVPGQQGSNPFDVPGVIGAIAPTVVTKTQLSATQTYTANYSVSAGITTCSLIEQGAGESSLGEMTRSNGIASRTLALTPGVHFLQARCFDAQGRGGNGPLTTVTVSVVTPGDTQAPTVSSVLQSSSVAGLDLTLSANYSDNLGVQWCNLYVNGSDVGLMTLNAGTASRNYTFSAAGNYAVLAVCRDGAGNTTAGTIKTIAVSGFTGPDTISPVVSQVGISEAYVNVPTTLAAAVWDNIGIASCQMTVNGVGSGMYQGSMSVSNGMASAPFTFYTAGNFPVSVKCWDATGNVSMSAVKTVAAIAAPSTPKSGSLVKTQCPDGASSDHPCKAVYYLGADGKRHAFPNEHVYFTWFPNFDDVREVPEDFMAQLSLGKNVTYRPGSRMVKFTTVPRVYAVGLGGILRWVTTEEVAASLYGPNWNTQIDDISDAFYTNYSFGTSISSVNDYNISGEITGATSLDANF